MLSKHIQILTSTIETYIAWVEHGPADFSDGHGRNISYLCQPYLFRSSTVKTYQTLVDTVEITNFRSRQYKHKVSFSTRVRFR